MNSSRMAHYLRKIGSKIWRSTDKNDRTGHCVLIVNMDKNRVQVVDRDLAVPLTLK